MDVKIEDRKRSTEYIRMALCMSEFGINYQHADLIEQIVTRVADDSDKLTIDDITQVFYSWRQKWQDYQDSQNKEKQ